MSNSFYKSFSPPTYSDQTKNGENFLPASADIVDFGKKAKQQIKSTLLRLGIQVSITVTNSKEWLSGKVYKSAFSINLVNSPLPPASPLEGVFPAVLIKADTDQEFDARVKNINAVSVQGGYFLKREIKH